jgi:uncharacterized membrane protein YdjX (TVP38/TMEM64 family)
MENTANETNKPRQPASSKKLIIGACIFFAILIGSYFIFPGFHAGVNEAFDVVTSDDQERIQRWVHQFGMLGPLVLIMAMTLQMFMLIIPNILLFVIAIICYGPVWGTLISLVGIFSSSSIGYVIGKKLGPRAIDRFVSQKIQDRIKVFIERYGIKAVAIFRLSSISTDSLGIVAGILEMNYKKYIVATLGGSTPVIILIAIYGKSGRIENALLWIAGISLVALLVYIYLDRHKRREEYTK